jgi:hypothetical protein
LRRAFAAELDDIALRLGGVYSTCVTVGLALGCNHPYEYRLFYGRSGKRIVGYGNERPKGDHRHRDGQEEPYEFRDVETLIRDFLADVETRRSQ